MIIRIALLILLVFIAPVSVADEEQRPGNEVEPVTQAVPDQKLEDEAALNEDPEAQRRTRAEAATGAEDEWLEMYGSVRVHAINRFDIAKR